MIRQDLAWIPFLLAWGLIIVAFLYQSNFLRHLLMGEALGPSKAWKTTLCFLALVLILVGLRFGYDFHQVFRYRVSSELLTENYPGDVYRNVDVSRVDLSGRVYDSLVFDDTSFDSVDLRGVVFRDCVFRSVTFTNTDLTGVRFRDSDLRGVTFTNSNLMGAAFEGGILSVDIHDPVVEDLDIDAEIRHLVFHMPVSCELRDRLEPLGAFIAVCE
jgi:hypothetical protein